ncbi:MAG: cytochrome c maturation protein CcmE [Alphaproteobacteria bacterium]|nr:cytochrome c maturation protein CcmE [Alphaproteobacteria bacterium]
MTRKQRRLAFLAGSMSVAAVAVTLVIYALGDATLFFYTPSEAKARNVEAGRMLNLGGLVAAGSIRHGEGFDVEFKVTDGDADVLVTYDKDLPDLFREGQGVVVTGAFTPAGAFKASNVMAKHDENYMPPEVARALKDKGVWKEGQQAP